MYKYFDFFSQTLPFQALSDNLILMFFKINQNNTSVYLSMFMICQRPWSNFWSHIIFW